ncbi:TonB-dependent siderophore receptor [Variovorax sp. GB1P17]|uniref:TonB-dependent siderophore receptor n=1 Tax=Variovorax sp. GB1P17 TaxID=3443740 RepID=UPI003F473C1B
MRNGAGASVAAVAGALAMLAAAGTVQAQEARVQFNIPAQPLASALRAFASQGRQQLLFDEDKLARLRAPALNGSYTPREALDLLLSGTGIAATRSSPGFFTLKDAPAASGAALPAVTVTATSDNTSEGTGSYAARASNSATRMNLSLRETPQSVSVITRQQMDDQALTNVPEILEKTVGVTVGRNDSERSTFYARGFSIENFQFDGVPNTMDSAAQYTTSLGDSAIYDRVEIVKGATGLLTGAGNPSATINLVRKRPTPEFEASVSGSIGSWDKLRGVADISGPLNASGSGRGRVVAAAQNANSYVNHYGRDTRNLYGIVEVDLAPRTLLSLGVDHMETRANGASYGHIPLFFSDGRQTHFSRSLNPATNWSYWNNESTNLFSTLKHEFDNGWKLDLSASRLRQSRAVEVGAASYGSLDAVTGAGLNVLSAKIPSDATTSAVNLALSGPFELFGREHELSIGLGWSRQARRAPGYSNDFSPVPNYFAWDGYFARPDFVHQDDRTTRIAEKGAFAAVRLRPADGWSVILGTRVSWYKLHDSTLGLDGTYKVADDIAVTHKTIPYAGVVYDVNRQWSLYASYTDIFNPQTFYKDSSDRALAPLTGNAAEVGIKGELLDRRLNTSLALFYVKQKNAAQYSGRSDATGNEIYKAVDGITSKGLELEVSGQLTPSWNIAGGYTFRMSRIPPQPNEILSSVNTNQPKHLVKLSTSYRLPGDWSRLTVGGSLSWQSSTYYQTSDGTGWRANQPSYAVVGLMARYEFNRHLNVALNINNLFDKVYMPGLGSYSTGVYGDPRNALLTVNYKF